ncbi:MAG: family 43 glycosylhydrolase [Alkalibacterium sp.]|nr:family 43 glycosylhydrolase [Alkalibacterium sp.]
MKKLIVKPSMIVLTASLLAVPVIGLSAHTLINSSVEAQGNNSNRPNQTYEMERPQFTEASVHDPSVIKVDDTFYVFGSHLASAKTDDFMNWTQVSTTVSQSNPLFDNVFEELEEAFDWANTDTLWAADVRQLDDGRFYMYYNASQGDAPRSALGLAIADDIEGPYEDDGIFIKSGMWDEISPDGTIYDATIHPNAIDPHTFYDHEGELWMVYGSYSGGLFILEMDSETGLPLDGQGYGTHLIGGNHSRIEGAFIEYNEDTGYYYLYMTFGGLDAVGGYNMRVARSERPDGPYVDAEGNLMSEVKGAEGSFFDDRSIEPFGVKQMGNYLFERQIGDKGTGIGTGYVSPGHNSIYTDEETGNVYMFFHTRFPQTGEMHEIRVHQLLMNEDGWPAIAPYRYAGEELKKVNRQDVIGDFKYINHGKGITDEIVYSETITLEKNNRISGAVTGTWKLKGQHNIELTIEGETYKGSVLRQWDPTSEQVVMTFTALSEKGVAVWGSQYENLSLDEILENVYNDLTLEEVVLTDLTLPTTATRQTTITWTSSNEDVISSEGVVRRPEAGTGTANVTLTAVIENGNGSRTKVFELTVPEAGEGRLVAHYEFNDNLDNSIDNEFSAGIVTGHRIDEEGGVLSFSNGNNAECQSLMLDGNTGVILPRGLISSHSYSVSLWLNPTELTQFTTAFFGARTSNDWLSLVPSGPASGQTMIWSGSQSWYDAAAGLTIPVNEWTHTAFTVDEGDISLFINGEEVFSGTGFPNLFTSTNSVFSLGVNYWDTPYRGLIDDLRVYDNMALSEEQVKGLYNTSVD